MKLPIIYDDTHFTIRKKVRNEYIKIQGGKCWHCKSDLCGEASKEMQSKRINKKLFPPNFFKWPHHLHHDRKTGLTIGTVHALCNAILWQYHGQ